jgi:hypothetical protein
MWKPQQVNALLASFSSDASSVAKDVASLRSAGAETPSLTAVAPAEALDNAAPVVAVTPAAASPVAVVSPGSPAAQPANTFRECAACPRMLNSTAAPS